MKTSSDDNLKPILILGLGYTGNYLRHQLTSEQKEHDVITTRRSSDGSSNCLHFDLKDKATWSCLPEARVTFWLFPAEPVKDVMEFWSLHGSRLGHVIAVGSTSAYRVYGQTESITERSDLNLDLPRVQGEEFLRKQGATIVRAAGIYGPERDPRLWLKMGRIYHGGSTVNLIHVYDLCQFLRAAMIPQSRGINYIAVDERSLRWRDIVWALKMNDLPNFDFYSEKDPTYRVDGSWSRRTLNVQLEYRHVLEGIRYGLF